VGQKENILASRYLMNPHLINGLKYDLRVYVLVTSFCPLKVYIYNDGLVRFATELYDLDSKKINQKFIHLTNFSINKKNTKFVKNNDESNSDNEGDGGASKWDFKQLEAAFKKQGHNFNTLMKEI
jgi:tubulin polyglutamylase TTLL4